jgi:hypothetical protein
MSRIRIIILIFFLHFISTNANAQNINKVELSYMHFASNPEQWVDKQIFESIKRKKDTVIFITKKNTADFKKIFTDSINDEIERIDIRVKIIFYEKSKIYKIIYIDNHGDYMIGEKFYKRNEELLNFVKLYGRKGYFCWDYVR